jgi:N-acetylmuramic acid 6-phosphate etherase
MVVQDLLDGRGGSPREPNREKSPGGSPGVSPRQTNALDSASVPAQFLAKLAEMHAGLKSTEMLAQLAQFVALEETVYRGNRKNNYFADRLGIDVFTDTTERSPTYCTPPFRKFDDLKAAASWAFLFLPDEWTDRAWQNALKRKPRCVEWGEGEIRPLVGEEKVPHTLEIVGKISPAELMRFRIGLNGAKLRPQGLGDSAIAVLSAADSDSSVKLLSKQLKTARENGSRTGLIYFGDCLPGELKLAAKTTLFVPVPKTDFLLDGVTRVAVKLVMNALSTCTMVRLGRVMGNYMVWVVPGNLKLIDRATRYISKLAGLSYEAANELLFEIIEYVEPRMKSDQAHPPVVEMAVTRARHSLTNEEAEKKLDEEAKLNKPV